MRKVFLAGSLVFVLGISGCGSSGAEAAIKEMVDTLNEMASTLESIKDDASADAAIPKLEAQVARIKALAQKTKDMKVPKEEDKRLQEKYMPEIAKAQQRLMTAGQKAAVAAPGKAQQVGNVLMKAGNIR